MMISQISKCSMSKSVGDVTRSGDVFACEEIVSGGTFRQGATMHFKCVTQGESKSPDDQERKDYSPPPQGPKSRGEQKKDNRSFCYTCLRRHKLANRLACANPLANIAGSTQKFFDQAAHRMGDTLVGETADVFNNVLFLGTALCDRKLLSAEDREMLEKFEFYMDVLDVFTALLSGDMNTTTIICKNFIRRHIDTKDFKYSAAFNVLSSIALMIRPLLITEKDEFARLCRALHKHNLVYKKQYNIVGYVDEADIVSHGLIDDTRAFLQSTMNSELMQACYKLLATILSIKVFKDIVPKEFFKYVKVPEKIHNPLELLDFSLSSLSIIERYFHSWMKGVPLKELIFATDPLMELESKIRLLYVQQDYLYTGLPKEGYRDIKDYAAELRDVVKSIPIFIKNMSPWRRSSVDLKLELVKLGGLLSNIEARIAGECRMTPFAIVFASPPGTGKSSVLRVSAAIFSEVRGREFDESQIYPRSRTSKYWEGYDPMTNPYIFYSEMGTMHEMMARSIVDERLIEMTSVIDNLTFYPDMAFEGKGKTKLYCELVLVDTNRSDMNLPFQVNNPAAFKRRWITVTAIVKPEYRQDGTPSIDPEKTRNIDRPMDLWYFRVVAHQPLDEKRTQEVTLLDGRDENSNIDKYCDLLRSLYTKHLEKEVRVGCVRQNIVSSMYGHPVVAHGDSDFSTPIGAYITECREKLCYSLSAARKLFDSTLAFVVTLGLAIAGITDNHPAVLFSVAVYAYLSGYLSLALSAVGLRHLWYCVKMCDLILLYVCYLYFTGHSFGNNISHSMHRMRSAYRRVRAMFSKVVSEEDIGGGGGQNYLMWFLAASTFMASGALLKDFLTKEKPAPNKVFVMKPTREPEEFDGHSQGDTKVEIASNGRMEGPVNTKIEVVEEKISAGLQLSRTKNALTDSYNVWDRRHVLSTSTQDLDDFAKRAMKNVIYFSTHTGVINRAYALGVRGQYVVTNKHLFSGSAKGTIRVYASFERDDAKYQEFAFEDGDVVEIANDVVMLRIPCRKFLDLTNSLNDGLDPDFATGFVALTPTRFTSTKVKLMDKNVGEIILDDAVMYEWEENKGGNCGLPLTCRIGGGDYLIGIHGAAAEPTQFSFGPKFTREQILRGICQLDARWSSILPIASHADTSIQLEAPLPKSPVHYLELRAIEYYGKLNGPVLMNKTSEIVPSPISESVDMLFGKHFPREVFSVYSPPVMKPTLLRGKYTNPYNVFLEKVAINKKSFCLLNFQPIVDELADRFVAVIPEDQRGKWTPLTALQALNGIPDDVYVRKIDLSTAGGFGYPGSKRPYVEGDQPMAKLSNKMEKDVNILLNALSSGDYVPTIFECQLKDEPRLLEKVLKGKTRVFCTSSFPSLLVQRMFLAPMYSAIVEVGHHFGIAIGVNMHTQAEKLWNKMIAFSQKWMEGDYSGYDLAMPVELAIASASLVYKVCQKMGYNEEALAMLAGVLTDQIFPYLSVNKDVFVVPGYQPSGKYGTAEDNSLRGLILLMAYWYTSRESGTFFENCCPLIYGDDVLVAVKEEHGEFMNNISYADFIKSNTSMEYTSAAKDGKLSKFVHPRDASFLKRKWYNRSWFGDHVVAALSLDSIKRSLNWILPSKHETLGNQVISTTSSAMRELLFHLPPNEVEAIRISLSGAIAKWLKVDKDLVLSKIPKAAEIHDSLLRHQEWCADGSLPCEERVSFWKRFTWNDLFGMEITPQSDSDEKEDNSDVPPEMEFSDLAYEMRNKMNALIQASKGVMDFETARVSKTSEAYFCQRNFRADVDRALYIHSEIVSLQQSLNILSLGMKKIQLPQAVTQSLSEVVPQESVREEKHVTLTDVDAEIATANTIMKMSNVHIYKDSKEDLDSFFSRPQLLATANITPLSTRFYHDVWDLYFANPTVRAKLRNYSMIRANLHLKLTLTGTPYHKGSLLVSYIPLPKTNAVYNMYLSVGANGNNFSKWLSQVPGAMKLDIRLNKPYEMTVPFIAPNPAARLYNASPSALSDASSINDIADLGELVIGVLNGISATGGATDPYYYLYGWLEDVELGPPTATVMTITTQGDGDERKTGPVEKYSTAASQVAMALSSVPVISPFARASAMALSAMSSISSLFGWSLPVMTTQPMRARVEPFQNSANLIGYDTGHRITMDPKQELTVDPRVCGSDTDDMMISAIAKRESLLDLQTWSYSSTPMTPIWRAFVMPQMHRRYVNLSKNYVQPTALHYSSIPFQAWRGSITLVFTFYPTSFHRGKIAVFYEPNCDQFSLISAGLSLNKNYLAIIDLQTTTEVSVCIKWAQPRYYQQCAPDSVSQNSISNSSSASVMRDYANGWVALVPITNLVGPAGYSVDYAVTVYSDDIEYAYPDQSLLPTITTQGDTTTQLDGPCVDLVDISSDGTRAAQLHYGERVFSFRALLKRFTQTDRKTLVVAAFNPGDFVAYRSRIIPPLLPSPTGVTTDASATSLLSFLRPSYLGMRGGFRKRIRITGHNPATMAMISVQLDSPDLASTPTFTLVGNSNITGIRGATQFIPYTNSGIEFEVPCYTNNLFGAPSNADVYDPTMSTMFLPRALRTYTVFMDCTSSATYVASELTATAEDFTLMNFIAATPYSYTT